ncbi:MAG: hypothetical protein JNK08_00400 [Sediminibacterium sp.]|nr:hypothetical protein [Sediminibacterium sp.]
MQELIADFFKRNRIDLMKPFEIVHKDETVYVIPRKIGIDQVYIIDFPPRRPPIMLAKAAKQGGQSFWTTIPEERQAALQQRALAEAALLGNLITTHYQTLVK